MSEGTSILHALRVMHEAKHQQFCASMVCTLRQMEQCPPCERPPLGISEKASSHLCTCLAIEALLATVLIVLLLSSAWEHYVCPQTLAIVSACSQRSALIRTLVLLCWCKLCFHSLAGHHLTMEGERLSAPHLQQFPRVTTIGSLPPKNLGK